jgi:hypothetical protein
MSTILPTVASLILAQAIGFVWYHPSLGLGIPLDGRHEKI